MAALTPAQRALGRISHADARDRGELVKAARLERARTLEGLFALGLVEKQRSSSGRGKFRAGIFDDDSDWTLVCGADAASSLVALRHNVSRRSPTGRLGA